MTTLLAMQGKDGLLIAADRRASLTNATYSDTARKIVVVYNNCCAAYCGDDGGLAVPLLEDAVSQCGASVDRDGDADEFANALCRIGRARFYERIVPGERKYSFGYVVVGYTENGMRPVLRVLNNEIGLFPCGEPTGWFWCSGRHDIIPHYNNLLGDRIEDIAVEKLQLITALVLLDTGAMCMSVSQTMEMFVVSPTGHKRVDTEDFTKEASEIRHTMSSTLRSKLGLPKL